MGGKGINSAETFHQWYNDDEKVNKRIDMQIELMPNKETKTLVFDKHDYFPIDGLGWNDMDPTYNHNYHFTLELHHEFTYHGGETFSFRGDDDIWVFINK